MKNGILKVGQKLHWYNKECKDVIVQSIHSNNNPVNEIKSPVITEKATGLSELNKVVYKVHEGASKQSIKKNIEKIFKVNVIKINTIKNKSKTKIVRGRLGKKSGFKKAVVTIKKGQTIDLATGV